LDKEGQKIAKEIVKKLRDIFYENGMVIKKPILLIILLKS
jgi:hypothetical protein